MVDIAFLLLVFFLVATTIMPRERDLFLDVPRPGTQVEAPPLPIVLELTGDGTVWWGEGASRMPVEAQGREMPGLLALLKPVVAGMRAGNEDEPPVMLKVADGVSQQRFVDLLNALNACEVRTVGMID